MKSSSLVRDTITTTAWSSIGKAAGLVIPFFIAGWFGSSGKTDAFFFCFAWTTGFSVIFSMALESVIVPYIAQARARGEDIGGFVGRVMLAGTLGLIVLTAAFIGALMFLLPFITNFSEPDLKLVRSLLWEIAPMIILMLNSSILAGLLNALKRFALPAVSPGIRAVLAVLFILLFRSRLGIHAVPIGYVLGEGVRLLFLLIGVRRTGIKPVWGKSAPLGNFFIVAGKQVAGMFAISMIPVVDKTMASWLTEGSISNLFYSERLYQIPILFLSGGILVTLLSHWSGSLYEGNDVRKSIRKAFIIVGGLSMGLLAIMLSLRVPLVRLAYARPGFSSEALEEVSLLYLILLFVTVPELISIILTRVCILYKQTQIIRNLGILRLVLKIGFNLLFMVWWGIYGLAVSSLVTMVISLVYLWRSTSRIDKLPL